jgi:Zn-dependent M28 family amino/carboxypeptidase
MVRTLVFAILVLAPVTSCGVVPAGPALAPAGELRIDADQLIHDVRVLSADSMEGRRTGTPGSARARAFLLERFRAEGLRAFGGGYEQRFQFTRASDGEHYEGVNLVGYVRGTERPDRYLVVTAHYDHLGFHGGQLHPGADDNASGTAALLALARHLRENPPRHTVVVAALDAEEMGLRGARAFVASPPVPRGSILLNVNMDMVSRNERDELYAAGTYHYPALLPLVEEVAGRARVTLRTGHDRPDLPVRDDWTMLSDHGAFHEVGIPFVYFGVEDHPDYHRPTDTFENIDPDFYVRAVETVLDFVRTADRGLQGQRPGGRSAAR